MLENLIIVATQVGVLFLLMAVGFVLGKLKWLDDATSVNLSRILLYVILPCVLIRSLQVPFTEQLMHALLWGCLLLSIHSAIMIVICHLSLRRTPPAIRAPLRFGQVYSNNLFMGLPLLLGVLGEDSAVYVVPALLVTQLLIWTHGIFLMGGKISPAKMVLNPGVMGVLIGGFFFLLGITLPEVVDTTLGHIGGMNTPLAMIIVGYQMSQADLKSTFVNKKLYATAFLRLVVSPLLALAILFPFRGMDSVMFCALVILSAAPSPSITGSFALQYGQDGTTGAQITTLSTLLSLFTLPVFAVIAKTIAF